MIEQEIKINTLEVCMTQVQETLKKLEGRFDLLDDKLDKKFKELDEKFVSRKEFGPVEKISYTLVSFVCLWALGKLLNLI